MMTPTDQWHTRNVVWSDQQTCVGLILPINAPNEIRTSARFAGKLLYAPPCKATCAAGCRAFSAATCTACCTANS